MLEPIQVSPVRGQFMDKVTYEDLNLMKDLNVVVCLDDLLMMG